MLLGTPSLLSNHLLPEEIIYKHMCLITGEYGTVSCGTENIASLKDKVGTWNGSRIQQTDQQTGLSLKAKFKCSLHTHVSVPVPPSILIYQYFILILEVKY